MNNKNIPIYIALGANLSNPKATFAKVLRDLPSVGVSVTSASSLWQSPAWPPGQGHPDYLNAVAEIDYSGDALSLLSLLHDLEAKYGRVRSERNAPRSLDLDILDFRGQVIKHHILEIPHPRMLTRGFVLFPLQEIAPDWRDPATQDAIDDFIARLPLADVIPMKKRGKI